jgi:hypothetical protein
MASLVGLTDPSCKKPRPASIINRACEVIYTSDTGSDPTANFDVHMAYPTPEHRQCDLHTGTYPTAYEALQNPRFPTDVTDAGHSVEDTIYQSITDDGISSPA